MAVIVIFPERLAADRRAASALGRAAEIVILPCIRRERIGPPPAALGSPLDTDRATQRHA